MNSRAKHSVTVTRRPLVGGNLPRGEGKECVEDFSRGVIITFIKYLG